MSKKSIQSTEVVHDSKDGKIVVLKFSAEARAALSTDGAQIRTDSSQSTGVRK